MTDNFKVWFDELDNEDGEYTLEAFIEDELDEHLKPTDDEDITYYPRLDD